MRELPSQAAPAQQQPYSSGQVVDSAVVGRTLDAREMDGSSLSLFLPQSQAVDTNATLPAGMGVATGLGDTMDQTGRPTPTAEGSRQETGSPYGVGPYAAYQEDRDATQSPATTQNDPMEAYAGRTETVVPQEGPLQGDGKEQFLDVFSELMTGSEHELSFLTRHFSEVLGPWYVLTLVLVINGLMHLLTCALGWTYRTPGGFSRCTLLYGQSTVLS